MYGNGYYCYCYEYDYMLVYQLMDIYDDNIVIFIVDLW